MADALFPGTQQRVLAHLFGQSMRSFGATELIRLVGAGSGAVQRQVQRLAECGLITVTSVGNQKHYQANAASPIFRELRGIVAKTLGPADSLRAALSPLHERIQTAFLFGSVAQGRDHAGSDIDVLIVSDNLTLEEIYAACGPAETRLGRKIHPMLFTGEEFRQRRHTSSILKNVLAGPRVPLIGNDDDLAASG